MRWALILRLESDFTGPFETHRILLLRTFDGGEKSGEPNTSAAICPERRMRW
jgi:hypothetical protein